METLITIIFSVTCIALAGLTILLSGQLKKKIKTNNQVKDQIRNQAKNQVWDEIKNQVENQVGTKDHEIEMPGKSTINEAINKTRKKGI